MKPRQMQAIKRIEKELKRAGELGLMGGVFDRAFCLWEIGNDPHGRFDFFDGLDDIGGVILDVGTLSLDGGAGV